jgi:hypothetical protein
METITAKELNERLRKEKTVGVRGMTFRIKCAPLMFLGDETDDFWELARQGKEALAKRIKELISNPKLPQFRRILLNGIVSPRISIIEGEQDAVPVDLLLGDYALAVSLYVEIIHFTLDSIPKPEG